MRLFFGVFLPDPVRDEVARTLERARKWAPSVRWAGQAKWHVTLQFLGELEEDRALLAAQIAREVAPLHAPFAVSLGGFGVFPHPHRPNVLWLGVEDGGGLRALAETLGAALVRQGFALEERPFHAHLTLARVKGRKEAGEVRQLLEEAARPTTSPFTVDSFALLESRAGSYLPRESFALTPATAR